MPYFPVFVQIIIYLSTKHVKRLTNHLMINKITMNTFTKTDKKQSKNNITQKTTNLLTSHSLPKKSAQAFTSVDLEPQKTYPRFSKIHLNLKYCQLRNELYDLQLCTSKMEFKNFLLRCSSTIECLLRFYMTEFFVSHVMSQGSGVSDFHRLFSLRRVLCLSIGNPEILVGHCKINDRLIRLFTCTCSEFLLRGDTFLDIVESFGNVTS